MENVAFYFRVFLLLLLASVFPQDEVNQIVTSNVRLRQVNLIVEEHISANNPYRNSNNIYRLHHLQLKLVCYITNK